MCAIQQFYPKTWCYLEMACLHSVSDAFGTGAAELYSSLPLSAVPHCLEYDSKVANCSATLVESGVMGQPTLPTLLQH